MNWQRKGILVFCVILLVVFLKVPALLAGEPGPASTPTREAAAIEEPAPILKWFERMRFFGDFRLRNLVEWTEPLGSTNTNTLQQFRLRLANETKIGDQWMVGARFVSGASYLRGAVDIGWNSTRTALQTMTNTFSTKMLNLDWAYAKWTPFEWFSVKGGKFATPFYKLEEFLFDHDVAFEGVTAHLNFNFEMIDIGEFSLFFTSGAFPLERAGNYPVAAWNVDPILAAVQGGFKLSLEDFYWKAAVAYWDFAHVQNKPLVGSAGTNTGNGVAIDNVRYDFRPISVTSEIEMLIPFVDFPGGLFGEFVYNTDSPNDDIGWFAGARVGHKKAVEQGKWYVLGSYLKLERDAWLDEFPNLSFHQGQTNVEGVNVRAILALWDNVMFGIDAYLTERIGPDVNGGGQGDRDDLFITDLIWNF
ncbi:putative porin [Bdellovibrionota bacterium]